MRRFRKLQLITGEKGLLYMNDKSDPCPFCNEEEFFKAHDYTPEEKQYVLARTEQIKLKYSHNQKP